MVLEICVDSFDSAVAAQEGGAHRIELCSDLFEGGITPSYGLIGAVRESLAIPVFVMIRPRAGDFFYTAEEFAVMKRDIAGAKAQGANGVVLGVLLQDGRVDIDRTRELVDLARPMEVTFHRAIDRAPQLVEAVDQVIATGADRILTSGGAQTAAQGAESIARMIKRAGNRIAVMAGGSIRKENIAEIARKTKAREYHAALRIKTESPVVRVNPDLCLGEPGIDEFARYTVSAKDVCVLRQAMQAGKESISPNALNPVL
jgi:copper homeostasis protein